MITWLDNPLHYSYVRKTRYITISPRFPVKSLGKIFPELGRLIGYTMVERKNSNTEGVYLYHHEFYWLKKHDRDLAPDGVYQGPRGFCGRMPVEAVDPVGLVEMNPFGGGDNQD